MENETALFIPETGDLSTGMIISLVLAVGCAFVGWRLGSTATDRRVRILLPMLLYFGCLLALLSAGGNLLGLLKYPTIEVQANKLLLDGEPQRWPNRGDIRLENVVGRNQKTIQIMLLKTAEGKTYAIPGDRYPVPEIMRLLRRD